MRASTARTQRQWRSSAERGVSGGAAHCRLRLGGRNAQKATVLLLIAGLRGA